MTIHRVQVQVEDHQEITAGRVISAKADREGRSDVIDVWFEVSGMAPDTKQGLWIFGTGHPTPWTPWTRYAWNFIDTIVTPSGLVWHVYVGPIKGEAVPG